MERQERMGGLMLGWTGRVRGAGEGGGGSGGGDRMNQYLSMGKSVQRNVP